MNEVTQILAVQQAHESYLENLAPQFRHWKLGLKTTRQVLIQSGHPVVCNSLRKKKTKSGMVHFRSKAP